VVHVLIILHKKTDTPFKEMPPKLIVLPSIFLGMLVGMACKPRSNDPDALEHILKEIQSPFVLWRLGVFLLLSVVIFGLRSGVGGLTRSQLRLLWIMAFLLGAIGTPLIYDIANR
jgi:hypothetical protein